MDKGNPFQRILEVARRLAKRLRPAPSGIIGSPPSARRVPADAAEHAADFARRHANEMDYHASNRMTQLGIPTDRIGATKYGSTPELLARGRHWRRQRARREADRGFGRLPPRSDGRFARRWGRSAQRRGSAIGSTPSSPLNGPKASRAITTSPKRRPPTRRCPSRGGATHPPGDQGKTSGEVT